MKRNVIPAAVLLLLFLFAPVRGFSACSGRVATLAPGESAEARVREVFLRNDPEGSFTVAREAFLADHDILEAHEGGYGLVFLARNKRTHALHRFKTGLEPRDGRQLERECARASVAGKLGLSPHAEYLPDLQLIRMENFDGKLLDEFMETNFNHFSARDQEIFLESFLTAMGTHLQALHAAGIAHLDLSPTNLVVANTHGPRREIKIIDYGLSLRGDERRAVHAREPVQPWPGTVQYQGRGAFRGKPTRYDDYESLGHVIDSLFPASHPGDRNYESGMFRIIGRPVARRATMPQFFRERPELRALLLLYDHAPPGKTDLASYGKLLTLAARKDLAPGERETFWKTYLDRFRERTPGQQQHILFADPALCGTLGSPVSTGLLARLGRDELIHILNEGVEENSRYYTRSAVGNWDRPHDPDGTLSEPFTIMTRGQHDIDLLRLREVRRLLGGPS